MAEQWAAKETAPDWTSATLHSLPGAAQAAQPLAAAQVAAGFPREKAEKGEPLLLTLSALSLLRHTAGGTFAA